MATKRTQATRAASEFSGRRTLSKAQFEQLRTLLANQAYTLRRETIDALLNTTRDVDEECQYPATIAVSDYQAMYCLLYTSPSPRDLSTSRMPSSA